MKWLLRIFRRESRQTDNLQGAVDRDTVLLEFALSLRQERRERKRRRAMQLVTIFGLLVMLAAMLSGAKIGDLLKDADEKEKPLFGVVEVSGVIGGTDGVDPARTIAALEKAFEHEEVERVILLIDSMGGSPHTAERIVMAMDRLAAEHPDKPLDAVINTGGASAAYLIAVHAERVIAGNYSTVGSIGAKMAGWDLHGLAGRFDVHQRVYASGSLKDMLNPFTEEDEAERRKAQEIVDQAAAYFADDVLGQRGDKIKLSREALTTGEIWMGKQALALGLIDEIGTLESLVEAHGARTEEFRVRPPLAERLVKSVTRVITGALWPQAAGAPTIEARW